MVSEHLLGFVRDTASTLVQAGVDEWRHQNRQAAQQDLIEKHHEATKNHLEARRDRADRLPQRAQQPAPHPESKQDTTPAEAHTADSGSENKPPDRSESADFTSVFEELAADEDCPLCKDFTTWLKDESPRDQIIGMEEVGRLKQLMVSGASQDDLAAFFTNSQALYDLIIEKMGPESLSDLGVNETPEAAEAAEAAEVS